VRVRAAVVRGLGRRRNVTRDRAAATLCSPRPYEMGTLIFETAAAITSCQIQLLWRETDDPAPCSKDFQLLAGYSRNSTGMPTATNPASSWTSQFVSRTQPWLWVLSTRSGSEVP
jgi:hypothetical protein